MAAYTRLEFLNGDAPPKGAPHLLKRCFREKACLLFVKGFLINLSGLCGRKRGLTFCRNVHTSGPYIPQGVRTFAIFKGGKYRGINAFGVEWLKWMRFMVIHPPCECGEYHCWGVFDLSIYPIDFSKCQISLSSFRAPPAIVEFCLSTFRAFS